MSKWQRTVPAMLIFILASAPFLYFQVGNLVYTQACGQQPGLFGSFRPKLTRPIQR